MKLSKALCELRLCVSCVESRKLISGNMIKLNGKKENHDVDLKNGIHNIKVGEKIEATISVLKRDAEHL